MPDDKNPDNTLVDEGLEAEELDFDAIVELQESSRFTESPIDTEFMSRFQPYFDSLGAQHFKAYELAFLGGNNFGTHQCGNSNQYPDEDLWNTLQLLIPALDGIREELGHPIKLSSVYRGPDYNSCIGGVADSQHLKFTAADCKVKAVGTMDLYQAAKRVRARGVFTGGIGLYNTFVHIDVRGVNADWSKVAT